VETHKQKVKEAKIEARFASIKEDVLPVDVTERKLQAERQKALARAAQKRREDERRVMEKLESAEAAREQRAARLKEKADQHVAVTAGRVEKLRRDRLAAKEREAELAAAEEQRRIDSQNKASTAAYKDRVDRLRADTEERLVCIPLLIHKYYIYINGLRSLCAGLLLL
jgi:hypothetical protein